MFVLNNEWPYPLVPHGMSILITMVTTWSYTLVAHGMFILTNVINKLVPYTKRNHGFCNYSCSLGFSEFQQKLTNMQLLWF